MTMGLRRTAPSTTDYTEQEAETEEVAVPASGLRAARKTARVVEPEPEEAVFEEEDEDEVPENAGIIQSGWGEAKKRLSQQSTLTDDFKVTEEDKLVRFVGEKPFMFDQHWIERQGKKSFICLGKRVCPLCRDLGDLPSLKYGFQVVDLSEDTEAPAVRWWIAGIKVYKQLEKYNDKAPLNRGYFSISKTGTKNATVHAISPVKERDLEEDWELDVSAVQELFATLKPLDVKTLRPPTLAELQEIADEIKRS